MTTASMYRLDRSHALQLFGWRMVIAAISAFVTFLAFGLGGFGQTVGWVLAIVTAGFVVAAILVLARPPRVISMNAQGIVLGRVTGSERRRVHWASVEKVETVESGPTARLIFRLDVDGEASVPLLLVLRRANELQADVHERLNTANGYRPLD